MDVYLKINNNNEKNNIKSNKKKRTLDKMISKKENEVAIKRSHHKQEFKKMKDRKNIKRKDGLITDFIFEGKKRIITRDKSEKLKSFIEKNTTKDHIIRSYNNKNKSNSHNYINDNKDHHHNNNNNNKIKNNNNNNNNNNNKIKNNNNNDHNNNYTNNYNNNINSNNNNNEEERNKPNNKSTESLKKLVLGEKIFYYDDKLNLVDVVRNYGKEKNTRILDIIKNN